MIAFLTARRCGLAEIGRGYDVSSLTILNSLAKYLKFIQLHISKNLFQID